MLAATLSLAAEPNPPNWPDSVHVFGPGDDEICNSIAASIFATNGGHNPENNGQFASTRHGALCDPH